MSYSSAPTAHPAGADLAKAALADVVPAGALACRSSSCSNPRSSFSAAAVLSLEAQVAAAPATCALVTASVVADPAAAAPASAAPDAANEAATDGAVAVVSVAPALETLTAPAPDDSYFVIMIATSRSITWCDSC